MTSPLTKDEPKCVCVKCKSGFAAQGSMSGNPHCLSIKAAQDEGWSPVWGGKKYIYKYCNELNADGQCEFFEEAKGEDL